MSIVPASVAIAAGQTNSAAFVIEQDRGVLAGVRIGSTWTAGTLKLQVSWDAGATWGDLYLRGAAGVWQLASTEVAANGTVVWPASDLAALNGVGATLRWVAGAAQTSGATLTAIMQRYVGV